MNIVRYNPYSANMGEEPPEDRIFQLRERIQGTYPDIVVRVVPRVGFDVKASCGMFVSDTPSYEQEEEVGYV